ncbi:MAG: SOS response-associated peptidase [Pseudomonadota bacterium]
MCGRFAVTLPSDAMAQLFAASPANDLPQGPNYNICPTNSVHVVTSEGDGRQLVSFRWGFLPHWYKTPSDGPLLINARAETIAEKPAFKSAARARRCLIPATGFYEWTKDEAGNRLPWYITPTDGEVLAFAGVWQGWDKGDAPLKTCAIVTTGANTTMSAIHHRMPVILRQEDWALWLGEAGHGAATLMRAAPEDALQFWRVDRAVNSNKAQGADLILPIDG